MAAFTWPHFERMKRKILLLGDPDCMPLMEQWRGFITEGNRRGVLSGVDGFDRIMPALKYRGGAGKKTASRRVPSYGTRKHDPTGLGPYSSGLHDNLTTSQYQRLTGPRLAPRGEQSRAIKNLETEARRDPTTKRWQAIGAWRDVRSVKGVAFLPFHFAENRGRAKFPRYDLRPVRKREFYFALNALHAHINRLMRVS